MGVQTIFIGQLRPCRKLLLPTVLYTKVDTQCDKLITVIGQRRTGRTVGWVPDFGTNFRIEII